MLPYERQRDGYTLSTDKSRLQVDVIEDFLANRSYWAKGRSRAAIETTIAQSTCFGIYTPDEEQAGFARVVTDGAVFAYLADVFILEAHRGAGLGKWLIESILTCPDLVGIKSWLLATADAHDLYSQFGFKSVEVPDRLMAINFATRSSITPTAPRSKA